MVPPAATTGTRRFRGIVVRRGRGARGAGRHGAASCHDRDQTIPRNRGPVRSARARSVRSWEAWCRQLPRPGPAIPRNRGPVRSARAGSARSWQVERRHRDDRDGRFRGIVVRTMGAVTGARGTGRYGHRQLLRPGPAIPRNRGPARSARVGSARSWQAQRRHRDDRDGGFRGIGPGTGALARSACCAARTPRRRGTRRSAGSPPRRRPASLRRGPGRGECDRTRGTGYRHSRDRARRRRGPK
jgi:hypothetical protein